MMKKYNINEKPSFSRSHFEHQGFTLVEIMIAITLGLFLMGGLVQIYASSKKSSNTQQQLATLQANQRFAIDFLNRDIRMAGFYDQSSPTAIRPVTKLFMVDGDDRKASNGAGDDSDVITVQYEATQDCLGNDIDDTLAENVGPNGNTIAINNYFILNKTLYCKGNNTSSDTLASQPIIDGVVNMQVLYGENTDPIVPGAQPTANHYVQAEQLATPIRVESVKIALLFETFGPVKNNDENLSYKLLDGSVLDYNDKHRRELVTTTIALRN